MNPFQFLEHNHESLSVFDGLQNDIIFQGTFKILTIKKKQHSTHVKLKSDWDRFSRFLPPDSKYFVQQNVFEWRVFKKFALEALRFLALRSKLAE